MQTHIVKADLQEKEISQRRKRKKKWDRHEKTEKEAGEAAAVTRTCRLKMNPRWRKQDADFLPGWASSVLPAPSPQSATGIGFKTYSGSHNCVFKLYFYISSFWKCCHIFIHICFSYYIFTFSENKGHVFFFFETVLASYFSCMSAQKNIFQMVELLNRYSECSI